MSISTTSLNLQGLGDAIYCKQHVFVNFVVLLGDTIIHPKFLHPSTRISTLRSSVIGVEQVERESITGIIGSKLMNK